MPRSVNVCPKNRVRYRRLDEAEAALVEANEIDPRDPNVLLALAQLLMNRGDWDRAREHAQALLRLDPTAPGPQELFNDIQLRQLRDR